MADEKKSTRTSRATVLKVVDALDHPHGGRILRTRILEGEPPTKRELKGAGLRAISPEGVERKARVLGFPVFGGQVSDARIRETSRVDLHVEEDGDGAPISLTWEIRFTNG